MSDRAIRRLRRCERCRVLGAWLQWAWVPPALALVALTAAGVVAGGSAHRGMPMSWTPLIAVFTGAIAGGVLVGLLGITLRLVAVGRARALARRPAVATVLAAQAAEPAADGVRFGRWRFARDAEGPALVPCGSVAVRRVGRCGVALVGAGCLLAAGVATPAVLSTRGGGADLVVTAILGLALLGLAIRPGPRPWRAAASDAALEPGPARVRRRFGRPGTRCLTVPAEGGPLRIDLRGWPFSCVQRRSLAAALRDTAPDVADRLRGSVPGDSDLPPTAIAPAAPAVPGDQPAGSSSSDAITDAGSVRGS